MEEPGGKLGVGDRYARHELEHGKRGIEGVSAYRSWGCFAVGFADTGSAASKGALALFDLDKDLALVFFLVAMRFSKT